MITGARMAAVDENAAALGVTRKQLMESSGGAVARLVTDLVDLGERVVILAGRGNNGGDAFVAARFLDAYAVEAVLVGHPDAIGTDIAAENWAALEATDIETSRIADAGALDLDDAALIVDALLGTGVSGDLREPIAGVASAINESATPVLSVDVPSGLDADTGELAPGSVEPDHVVTFHDTKPGLADLTAAVHVADIGIPRAATTRVGPGDRNRIRTEERSARVYVIGGGPYAGAPALAGQGALGAGAELSFVAVPAAVADTIQSFGPDLIVQPFEGETLATAPISELVETARRYDDVVVLGPGLGTDDETLAAARSFLEQFSGPVIVDADALRIVPSVETAATLVCTPNPAELTHLGGPELADPGEDPGAVAAVADDLDAVVLAKGATDVISDGERTRTNPRGHPGMAVGGTGDVLAGVVATLCDHAPAFEAAAVAAYVAATAGEQLATADGSGFLASEQADAVSAAMWGDIDD